MASDEDRDGGSDGGGDVKCPECPPCTPGLPMWMATFSDMCTLLLTFFILLVSFAKFEDSKAKSVSGSIQDAFGGNSLQPGEVIMEGRTNDNTMSMLDSQNPPKPFPIEFMSAEGILDKHEINRETSETIADMKQDLKDFDLTDLASISETPQGVFVRFKEQLYFENGSAKINELQMEPFKKMIDMVIVKDWTIFVEGFAASGESAGSGSIDAFYLSSLRAAAVTKYLAVRGIKPDRITTVFYGDTRPVKLTGKVDPTREQALNRRVEFIIRKTDLRSEGHKVE